MQESLQSSLLDLEAAARGEVRVSALRGGEFTLPSNLFVAGVSATERMLVPSLSFLIVQRGAEQKSRRILFDLGLRRDTETYAPPIQQHLNNRQPMRLLPDIRRSLLDGSMSLDKIDHVVLSHVHWDHIGTPADFPTAQFFVGAGSLDILRNGLNGHMSHSNFQADLFEGLHVQEFPRISEAERGSNRGWRDVGGMKILDFTDDDSGSIFVVDSPGHLTGHANLLVRTGRRRWALLIGDACHDGRLLSGEMPIAEWTDDQGRLCCIHVDKKKATETLKKIREWVSAFKASGMILQVIFAHDAGWANAREDAFFPGIIQ